MKFSIEYLKKEKGLKDRFIFHYNNEELPIIPYDVLIGNTSINNFKYLEIIIKALLKGLHNKENFEGFLDNDIELIKRVINLYKNEPNRLGDCLSEILTLIIHEHARRFLPHDCY